MINSSLANQISKIKSLKFEVLIILCIGCNCSQTENNTYNSELKEIENKLFVQGNWEDAISIAKIELQKPNLNEKDELYYLQALGENFRFSEDYGQAEKYFKKVISHSAIRKYPELLGEAFYGLGDLHYLEWSYLKKEKALDIAIELLDSSMHYASSSQNLPLVSKNLYRSGTILQIQGKSDSSMINFRKGLELSISISDTSGIIRNDIHKASDLEEKGVLDSALFHYERAYQLAKIKNKNYTEAHALCNLGLYHLNTNQYYKAKEYFDRAMFLSEELDHTIILCRSCYGLSLTEDKLGNLDDAIEYAELGLSLAKEKGYNNYIQAFSNLINNLN